MIKSNHMRKTNIQLLRANKLNKKPFLIKESKYKTIVKYQKHTKTDTLIVTKFKGKHIQINIDKYSKLISYKIIKLNYRIIYLKYLKLKELLHV